MIYINRPEEKTHQGLAFTICSTTIPKKKTAICRKRGFRFRALWLQVLNPGCRCLDDGADGRERNSREAGPLPMPGTPATAPPGQVSTERSLRFQGMHRLTGHWTRPMVPPLLHQTHLPAPKFSICANFITRLKTTTLTCSQHSRKPSVSGTFS